MNRRQSDTLEHCINLLESGVSLQEIFITNPDLTPELCKLLESASEILGLSADNAPAEAIRQSRANLLERAKELSIKDKETPARWNKFKPITVVRQMYRAVTSMSPLANRLILIFGLAVIFVLFSGGMIITSAKSLPGDTLYPVKRAVEDLSVSLMPDKNVRSEYENNYRQERVTEIDQLLDLKRSQQVSFIGVVQSIDDGEWLVNGISVMISTRTKVGNVTKVEMISVGSVVEVEGTTTMQGWVNADEIHLHEFEMDGLVEVITSHYWQISGNRLNIKTDTDIDSGIQVGDEVIVTVNSGDDGLTAYAIHLLEKSTQTPELYPSETMDSPGSTETEEMHEVRETSSQPTDAYKPTDTPEPGDHPEHSPTPMVTPTPGEGDRDDQTVTPHVSPTPSPSVSPDPTHDD